MSRETPVCLFSFSHRRPAFSPARRSCPLSFEGGKKEGDDLNFGSWIMARYDHIWRIVVSPKGRVHAEEDCAATGRQGVPDLVKMRGVAPTRDQPPAVVPAASKCWMYSSICFCNCRSCSNGPSASSAKLRGCFVRISLRSDS